jgi:hypothetical protein
MPDSDGQPLLFVLYLQSDRGYEYYKWNGSEFEALPDHSIWPEDQGWERRFTHNIVGEAIHLVFRDGDRLRHVWKDRTGGEEPWQTGLVPTVASSEIDPVSTVRGDRLYLFYSYCTDDADPATAEIRAIVWDQQSETWGEEIEVSTGDRTHNILPNTCFHVPLAADYVPVFWTSGADGGDIVFSKLLLEDQTTGAPDVPHHGATLLPGYPNPFNPSTTIPFVLEEKSSVRVGIYDLSGRLVKSLVRGELGQGRHEVIWLGDSASGRPMPSGVYHVRLSVDGVSQYGRLSLVR